MKNKKLTGQQIKFIINMIGLAVFAISYLYVYTDFTDKTAATYNQIAAVKASITGIEEKAANEEAVFKNTQDVRAQMQSILDSYPVNITKVDNLLFVEKMEGELGISFASVTTTDSNAVYRTILPIRNEDGTEKDLTGGTGATETVTDTAASESTVDSSPLTAGVDATNQTLDQVDAAANGENQAPVSEGAQIDIDTATTMIGTESTITMNFTTSYDGFKKLVDYINHYPDKTEIDSVSVSKDSTTGLLSGSLVLKRYALTGTGKVYVAPVIDNISIGTDNIFGSDASVSEETTAPEDTTPVEP